MPPALAVRLTCQACARRKVKCDKKSPCANCLKHGISCIAVERARWPRGRSGKKTMTREQELHNRVAKLEQIIQNFTLSARGTSDVSSSVWENTARRSGRSPNSTSGTMQTSEKGFVPQPVSGLPLVQDNNSLTTE
jgi:hypothetical protein